MDLLLSMRAALLLPKPEASVGDMVLFDGPLGQVLGGSDPDLVFGEQRAMVTAVHNVLPTVRTSTLRAHGQNLQGDPGLISRRRMLEQNVV